MDEAGVALPTAVPLLWQKDARQRGFGGVGCLDHLKDVPELHADKCCLLHVVLLVGPSMYHGAFSLALGPTRPQRRVIVTA